MKPKKNAVMEFDESVELVAECRNDEKNAMSEEDLDEFVTSYECDESEFDNICYQPEEKIVSGYKYNECEITEGIIRDSYSNIEVSEYLGNYFKFFGQKDMDIIYLYFLSGKKQEDLVQILDKSQPAISYDVTRIKQQMDFVIKLVSSLDDFIMFVVDDNNGLNAQDREMLTLFFYSTSIIKTSRLMNISNITCRSHLNTIVNRLLANGHVNMYNLFKYIMSNLNSIKKYVARENDK